MAAFWVLNNQFLKFINWQYFLDYDSEMTEKLFAEYTGIKVKQFRETLLLHMGNVKKCVAERTRHKRQYDRRMNERHMQSSESKVVSSKALDVSLVVTECSGTKSDEHITSSSLGTYITHVMKADIKPVNDQMPSSEVDSNTTPDSTNMCHRGGEIDQDAEQYQVKSPFLNGELVQTKEMIEKETYNDFHAEHSVAKLLVVNEQLHKENKHLKQTYKELYDSIKKTRVQNKDNSDSLISQINQKSVENADLKAQIQEKVFANAALKNELRKLKGNSVDTKFAKASILGKPPLQPSRNHSVVRQPNAFKSERPRISKPRFASQVDEKNVLSKPVTPHYLPNVRESAPAKPQHVNAPSSYRNSTSFNPNKERLRVWLPKRLISHKPGVKEVKYENTKNKKLRTKTNGSADKTSGRSVVQEPVVSTGIPSSMRIDQDTPSTSTSETTQEAQSHVIPTSVKEDDHDHLANENVPAPAPTSSDEQILPSGGRLRDIDYRLIQRTE
ncbi:hypothetical protein Tco_0421928 [Tanacetum coccineum]